MPKSQKPKKPKGESTVAVDKLLELVRSEVRRQLGPDATYEERRDQTAEVMSEVLRRDEELLIPPSSLLPLPWSARATSTPPTTRRETVDCHGPC